MAINPVRLIYDCANTTNQVADCRLHVEMSATKELQDNGETSICWIGKDKQGSTMYLHD